MYSNAVKRRRECKDALLCHWQKIDLGELQEVYIDFNIATLKAEPLFEGNFNELFSTLVMGPYVGVSLQLIPDSY